MIKLEPFNTSDFDRFISWVDSRELLVTIAGNLFSYPVTTAQLQNYLQQKDSHSFNVVDMSSNKVIGHAELILSGKDLFKIDKLIIGDKSKRGKGVGQEVIHALLKHAFTKLQAKTVELNVFDWNIGAIRCYEKCGFVNNPGKQAIFKMDDKDWLALNMAIEKDDWERRK